MQAWIENLFHHIKTKQRFAVDDPYSAEVLRRIEKTCGQFIETLSPERDLYRAQRGCVLEEVILSGGTSSWCPRPFTKERMIPLPNKVGSGRVSPKGIAALYLAENMETAIQEMRPVPREILTVATFNAKTPLKVCRLSHKLTDGDNRERWFWSILGNAFSKPTIPSENPVEYAPTQYIAEVLKRHCDGIAYQSIFSGALNYAFFDIESCEIQSVELRQIQDFPELKPEHLKVVDQRRSIITEFQCNGKKSEMTSHDVIYEAHHLTAPHQSESG
ncbi:RES family NAD+ phosphorylase [Pontiellaceae bacterium B12219]|nr:RES family NAD+ phosphorylase [Pontiellaceae bacterium B12219]